MSWPTAVTKTNLDAGTDHPNLARAELAAAIDALNALIAQAQAALTAITTTNIGDQTVLNSLQLGGHVASYYQPAGTAITTATIASQTVANANAAPWSGITGKPGTLFTSVITKRIAYSGTDIGAGSTLVGYDIESAGGGAIRMVEYRAYSTDTGG